MTETQPTPPPDVNGKERIFIPALLALLAGAAGVLALEPFSVRWLAALSLAVLYDLVHRNPGHSRPRRAALIGFCFGLGYFLCGVSWVFVSLNVFGGMSPELAGLSTFLFCTFLAFYPAATVAAFVYLKKDTPVDTLLFAALIALAEWIRSWLFTGFPWLGWGYAHSEGWLASYAPLAGVLGITTLVAFIGACLAQIMRMLLTKDIRLLWMTTLVLAVSAIIYTGWTLRHTMWTEPTGEPVRVALVQGNIPQQLKWDEKYLFETLASYESMIDEALPYADLIVLPETAFPLLFDKMPTSYLRRLESMASDMKSDLLFGVPTGSSNDYFNSAVGLGISGTQRYDKIHLVPFGETTPPGFSWFMNRLNIPMSNFASGATDQPLLGLAGQKVAVNICYEDIFGNAIAAGAEHASLLVNISNTAWFGRSLAQAQHMQIAQMRARETGRPMLRATNTGMTVIIDGTGFIIGKLEPFYRGILYGEIRGRSGTTPYMRYRDMPLVLILLLMLMLFVLRHYRETRRQPDDQDVQ